MAKIDSFLRLIKEQRASDLHLCVGSPPVIRFNGELVSVRFRDLTHGELTRMLYETMDDAQIAEFEKNLDIDLAYSVPGLSRYRVHVFMDDRGIGAAFRIIPEDIASIDELNLPQSLKRFAYFDKGLVLVTGATGSGKSTTLAAILNEVNEARRKHIITVEDPIEFIHAPKRSVFSQREVGAHTSDFGSALRSCLREAPDVILIGELRDIETIQLALTCSETGTLVFSTLHTQSAAQTVDRIIDVFPVVQQEQVRGMLSLNLVGVVSQTLLKTFDETKRCAAIEILFGSPALGNLIRESKTYQIDTLIQLGGYDKTGMQTLDQAMMRLVDEGRVTPEEARKHAREPANFAKYFKGAA
jgi:twitching motility protein PilT